VNPTLPKSFHPHRGLLGIAERLARVVEKKSGFEFWDGEEGLGGVVAELLESEGVPKKPIGLTPRQLAEQAGFVKRKRKPRARRATT
jgi:hypothetical protein